MDRPPERILLYDGYDEAGAVRAEDLAAAGVRPATSSGGIYGPACCQDKRLTGNGTFR